MAMRTTMMIGTLALVMALSATTAHAQDGRLRVSLGSAVTAGAIDSELALAASVGYRFMDRVSFEVEVTGTGSEERFGDRRVGAGGFVDSLVARAGNVMTRGAGVLGQPRLAAMPISFGEREGRTLIATLGFRYELPTQGGRLRPYVSAGLGMARTNDEFTFAVTPVSARMPGFTAGAARAIDESHTGLATGAGIGASIRVYKELSVDVDARYIRLDRDQNLGRFGGGVSYRF